MRHKFHCTGCGKNFYADRDELHFIAMRDGKVKGHGKLAIVIQVAKWPKKKIKTVTY
jgi:hypothetical protein